MASTVKPTGLSVARDGLKFTLSWKVADKDYGGGLQVRWRNYTGPGKGNSWSDWTNINVLVGDTSASKSFSATSFWPVTDIYFYGICFQVRGKRETQDGKSYDWSAWAEYTLDLKTPNNPALSQELDDDVENITNFSWKVNTSTTDTKPFYNIEWQSILVKDCMEKDGSKLAWKTTTLGWLTGNGATGADEGTLAIPPNGEDMDLLGTGSYTRWFRARSRGCGGNGDTAGCSAWRYSKHVYATPLEISLNRTKSQKASDSMWTRLIWSAPTDAAHPIDKIDVQWVIDNPLYNSSTDKLMPPNDPSWTTAATLADTALTDQIAFCPDQSFALDQCMWARVVATHDRIGIRSSDQFLIGYGPLTPPDNLSVVVGSEDRRVTVHAELDSDVPNARVAILFQRIGADGKEGGRVVIGILDTPQGEVEGTFRYPYLGEGQSFKIGVYSFEGPRSQSYAWQEGEAVTRYTINANMTSEIIWEGGYIPQVPDMVTATATDREGEVLVTWRWRYWADSNRAEVSWSDNPNAWESTERPSSYMMTNLDLSRLYVSGLDLGKTWYFRIRLAAMSENGTTYGPYTESVPVTLAAVPTKPVLAISQPVVKPKGKITFSWVYSTDDGSPQAKAEIKRIANGGSFATIEGSDTRYTGTVNEKWPYGEETFTVQVTSASGMVSEWSDPASVIIADPVTCALSYVQGSPRTFELVTIDGRVDVFSLVRMPMQMVVTGAPAGGTASLLIERINDFSMLRPDGTTSDGYVGETIAIFRQSGTTAGTNTFIITTNDLIGVLDDGARYRFIATVEDTIGQTATARRNFEVHWADQAKIPSAAVEMIGTAAKITASKPAGDTASAVCDIYRLTADVPELIVEGGTFGVAYVDPYPAIGHGFGHRVVYRTDTGDYITAANELAMTDITDGDGDILDLDHGIIDFDGHSLPFIYDIELTSDWTKDFKETRYMGGTILGDWNLGVSRTMTINAKLLVEDLENYQMLRRLAEYTGICHVRTPDGSSFSADVQVGDGNSFSAAGKINSFSLNITRVEPVALDGIPYSEWVTA